ncbi:hypothetical protein Purlil1_2642 [Purpureocillium lilacinum]|uniref:Uncharacterized protein n=1 Tax=Purpureocillium lilacinum TaxID=33203 RepID=A0ABR0C8W3_PURLI|nr:hypothetical protein Purlil1_2642 [Purpureocillium lilacinum]
MRGRWSDPGAADPPSDATARLQSLTCRRLQESKGRAGERQGWRPVSLVGSTHWSGCSGTASARNWGGRDDDDDGQGHGAKKWQRARDRIRGTPDTQSQRRTRATAAEERRLRVRQSPSKSKQASFIRLATGPPSRNNVIISRCPEHTFQTWSFVCARFRVPALMRRVVGHVDSSEINSAGPCPAAEKEGIRRLSPCAQLPACLRAPVLVNAMRVNFLAFKATYTSAQVRFPFASRFSGMVNLEKPKGRSARNALKSSALLLASCAPLGT